MADLLSYCHIRNSKILKEGRLIYEEPDVALDDFLVHAYEHLQVPYPKFYKMDRLSKLGFLACETLLKGKASMAGNQTALVLSNASASLDTDLRYWESVKTQASPSLFVYTLPNIVAGEICIRHALKGENVFFVSPRFDPVETTRYVDMLFSLGVAQYCIAGWVEVLESQADVFLYLTQKSGGGTMANAAKISELYTWKP